MSDRSSPRLIEVDFPLRQVSEESVREKNIRHGHISTLHIWWARRPLAASRATALAALLPDDPARREELLRRVQEVSPWEVANRSNAQPHPALQKARELIREAFNGRAPKVLDCFAGGGAIPLEALRLGCETYALDYNPVAVLILKAVLEYPQRFGRPSPAAPPLPQLPGRGPGVRGKRYRLANVRDLGVHPAAEAALERKRQALWADHVCGEGAADVFCDRGSEFGIRDAEADEFAHAAETDRALASGKLATHLRARTRWRPDTLSFERAFDRRQSRQSGIMVE